MKKNIQIETFYFELNECYHYVFLGRGHLVVDGRTLYMEYCNDPNLLEKIVESVSQDRRGRNSIKSEPKIKHSKIPQNLVLLLEEAIGKEDKSKVLKYLKIMD